MRKLAAVIRREFVERVRTKAFIIGTILLPASMGILIFGQILLAGREGAAKRLVVIDAASGSFGARVEAALEAARIGSGEKARPKYLVDRLPARTSLEATKDSLIRLVGVDGGPTSHPDGLLILTDQALESGTIEYLGVNVGSPVDMEALGSALRPVVQAERLVRHNVDSAAIAEASGPVRLDASKITAGKLTGESGAASFGLAYAITFILYLALLLYGIQVMQSILEEKTNRIFEVLVSSLTPFELMLGKIIGVGSVGLFQLLIWAAAAVLLSSNIAALVGGGEQVADVASVHFQAISGDLIFVLLLFFVLGFLFYAALYAAVGAMCNSQQDTQQANTPITMCVAAGILCLFPVLNEPNGTLARTLSLIPFWAPFATPIRYSISPLPPLEVLVSALVTALGLLGTTWLGSRVYRIGILSYGKRPSMRELVKWIRSS